MFASGMNLDKREIDGITTLGPLVDEIFKTESNFETWFSSFQLYGIPTGIFDLSPTNDKLNTTSMVLSGRVKSG